MKRPKPDQAPAITDSSHRTKRGRRLVSAGPEGARAQVSMDSRAFHDALVRQLSNQQFAGFDAIAAIDELESLCGNELQRVDPQCFDRTTWSLLHTWFICWQKVRDPYAQWTVLELLCRKTELLQLIDLMQGAGLYTLRGKWLLTSATAAMVDAWYQELIRRNNGKSLLIRIDLTGREGDLAAGQGTVLSA